MKLPILLTAAVLSVASLNAQTTITGMLDSNRIGYVPAIKQYGYVCGRSDINCYAIPITFSGVNETIWTDTSFIYFLNDPPYWADPLGLQGYTANGNFWGAHFIGVGSNDFYGTTTDGRAYTGTISEVFTHYRTSGGGGKGGGGAGTIYVLLAATVTITFQ
jgi:hypothetical protein